ncbi:hypothetical protein C5L14_21160 [Labrys okinawensis]|uniref:Uncharacterized protein n=1 Tax=Labrys okinawensis TaxID=346911 RepID=A0A2S9Q860_9HYPH|nr:hypothetical protein C5L14_21160 [Labrys okinawensis]
MWQISALAIDDFPGCTDVSSVLGNDAFEGKAGVEQMALGKGHEENIRPFRPDAMSQVHNMPGDDVCQSYNRQKTFDRRCGSLNLKLQRFLVQLPVQPTLAMPECS